MAKVNRVPENTHSVSHDSPQGTHAGDADQLLGLVPPDSRRARDPRQDYQRYDPASYTQARYERPEARTDEQPDPVAAHPLLRGLLSELPARTEPPTPEFLETWITTARSILDLLYRPGSRH